MHNTKRRKGALTVCDTNQSLSRTDCPKGGGSSRSPSDFETTCSDVGGENACVTTKSRILGSEHITSLLPSPQKKPEGGK